GTASTSLPLRCPPAAGSPRTGPTMPPSAATTSTAETELIPPLRTFWGVERLFLCKKRIFPPCLSGNSASYPLRLPQVCDMISMLNGAPPPAPPEGGGQCFGE